MDKLKQGLPPSLITVVTFALLTCFFPPLQSYLPQPEEFRAPLKDALLFCLLLSILVMLVFEAISFVLKRMNPKWEYLFVWLLQCSGVALFIQQFFFTWDYGPLGTQEIYWSKYYFGFIDSAVWLLCFLLGYKYHNFIAKQYHRTAAFMVTFALFLLCFTYFQNHRYHTYFGVVKREDTVGLRNTFSKKKNVILMVLDGFQGNAFQELIDKNSDLKKDFKDFTYYRNNSSRYGFTHHSSANYFSGDSWDGEVPFDHFPQELVSKRSFPKDLKRNGVEVEYHYEYQLYYKVDEEASFIARPKTNPVQWFRNLTKQMAYIYDFGLFKLAPHYLKRFVMNDGDWLLSSRATRFTQRVDDLKKIVNLRSEQDLHELMKHNRQEDIYFFASFDFPTKLIDQEAFKYFHVLGPHFPLVMDENLGFHSAIDENEAPDVRRNYLNQAHGYLKMVKNTLFPKLKNAGIWDDTMIIVIGDHGGGTRQLLTGKQPGTFPHQYDKAQANSLMLIKPFGSNGPLKINDAPVALGDIPKTVLTAYGLNSSEYQGMDIFSIPEGLERKRNFTIVNFEDKQGARQLSVYGYHPIYDYEINGNVWDDNSWKLVNITR